MIRSVIEVRGALLQARDAQADSGCYAVFRAEDAQKAPCYGCSASSQGVEEETEARQIGLNLSLTGCPVQDIFGCLNSAFFLKQVSGIVDWAVHENVVR